MGKLMYINGVQVRLYKSMVEIKEVLKRVYLTGGLGKTDTIILSYTTGLTRVLKKNDNDYTDISKTDDKSENTKGTAFKLHYFKYAIVKRLDSSNNPYYMAYGDCLEQVKRMITPKLQINTISLENKVDLDTLVLELKRQRISNDSVIVIYKVDRYHYSYYITNNIRLFYNNFKILKRVVFVHSYAVAEEFEKILETDLNAYILQPLYIEKATIKEIKQTITRARKRYSYYSNYVSGLMEYIYNSHITTKKQRYYLSRLPLLVHTYVNDISNAVEHDKDTQLLEVSTQEDELFDVNKNFLSCPLVNNMSKYDWIMNELVNTYNFSFSVVLPTYESLKETASNVAPDRTNLLNRAYAELNKDFSVMYSTQIERTAITMDILLQIKYMSDEIEGDKERTNLLNW